MRGAQETYYEYIPELHTECDFSKLLVGCDGVAHVISAGVLSDTHEGKQRELFMKKGGNTRFRPFQSMTGKDFFIPTGKGDDYGTICRSTGLSGNL